MIIWESKSLQVRVENVDSLSKEAGGAAREVVAAAVKMNHSFGLYLNSGLLGVTVSNQS